MNGGKLQGRVALITGASRNIGRAVALAFGAEGAALVLNTRVNGDELEAVAAAPAPPPARGHRGRVRVPGLGRLVLRHRRLDPRDGRAGHRLRPGRLR